MVSATPVVLLPDIAYDVEKRKKGRKKGDGGLQQVREGKKKKSKRESQLLMIDGSVIRSGSVKGVTVTKVWISGIFNNDGREHDRSGSY